MSVRRMLPFIFINIVVSAVVVLSILYWWDGRQTEQAETEQATSVAATAPVATIMAEVAAQITDTPPPADEPAVHVVSAGDTLGNISQFYDVPMEDIMTANGITNPNVLSIGQQLIIPVGGLPTATPEPTATPAPDVAPTPNPTEPPEQGEAIIEIAGVIGAGQLTEEAVQVINTGSRQIALVDWQLGDEDGHVYRFGQITLFGDGAGILVHTETGQDGPTDLYWGLEQPIWQTGELVTLRNAEGAVQATFEVP